MPQGLPSPDKLLAAIRMAASIVESSKTNFDKDQMACIRRWRAGSIPRLKTLKELLAVILNLETEGQKSRPPDDLEPAFGEFMPREPVPQNACRDADAATTGREAEKPKKPETKGARKAEKAALRTRAEFAAWFVESFDAVRLRQLQEKRRIRDAEKKDPALFLKRIRAKPKPLVVRPEVVAAVDKFLREAGVQVVNGCGLIGAEIAVRLQPLYEYVERIQFSARIPSYFPGVPDIVLDELYVELSTAPDQRPRFPGGREFNDPTLADPKVPDHFGRWRLAAYDKRISPEEMLAEAEVRPVVVLGDPGSGKSTLVRHLLQEIGRGFGGLSKIPGQRVIPFRIALKEFVPEARSDGFSLLRYIVRQQLCVDEGELAHWVSFLRQLATNKRPFRLLLLVDGIDEASPEKDSYKIICKEMVGVCSLAKLVFTSRRAGFSPPVTSFDKYELVPLSDLSVQAMIRNWFRVVRVRPEEFIAAFTTWIFGDSRRQEMAGNPCLLALLCYLNEDKTGGQFLQATCRAHLYGLAVEKLRKDASREGTVLVDATLSLLAGFAIARYTGNGGWHNPEVLFREQQAIGHLRVKLGDRAFGELEPFSVLDSWRRMRLVARWDLESYHHFIHQTFQEYFAACGLLLFPADEVEYWLAAHGFNPFWREVWRFYAGLCRDHLPDGLARFGQLIQSICVPYDEFGEVGFVAAALCMEHGLSDSTKLLGYDLRVRLFDLIRSMTDTYEEAVQEMMFSRVFQEPQLVPRVRIMVELDPQYFLEWVRRTLDRRRGLFPIPLTEAESSRASADALLAVLVLNCIHHPDAMVYQRELIKREMRNCGLKPSDPPLGPCLATARNESLCEQLVSIELGSLSKTHRIRLARYLECTRSQSASVQLLRIASDADFSTADGVAIACRCFVAMCSLKDSRAIHIARRALQEHGLPNEILRIAWEPLAELRTSHAKDFFEELLMRPDVTPNSMEYRRIVYCLEQWPDSKVPNRVNLLLESGTLPVDAEATSWGLVLAREGEAGFERLERRLMSLASSGNLVREDWRRIEALANCLVRSTIPRFETMEYLASRVPRDLHEEWQRIWCGLIYLHACECQSWESAEWLMSKGIPLVEAELMRFARSRGEMAVALLAGWSECTLPVLESFVKMVMRFWHMLPAEDAAHFFRHNFDEHPELVPVSVARTLFESEDGELAKIGRELLLKLDPGFLLASRKMAIVEELLRETSAKSGVLFFRDRLYNPALPGYVEYLKD